MPRLKVRHAWGSRSTRRTCWPCSARAAPSEATVVVLATPPFWLATATTWVAGIRAHCAVRRGAVPAGGSHASRLSDLGRPRIPRTPHQAGARSSERHLERLGSEPGHVGEQPVVVQQQGGRRRPHHQPEPPPVGLAGEDGAGEQVVVGEVGDGRCSRGTIGGVVHEPDRHGPATGAHVDRGRAVADLRPRVVVRRAGAARPEPDPGILRDDGDLDLAVEVAGADRRGDGGAHPAGGPRRSRSRRSSSPGSSARAGRSGGRRCGPPARRRSRSRPRRGATAGRSVRAPCRRTTHPHR